jgi:acetylornithine deacetylase/succinyl-diaminopimelate desuccinylase-like protein
MLVGTFAALDAAEPDVAAITRAVRLHLSENEAPILRDLTDLLTLPNVATDLDDTEDNARYLVELFATRGFDVKLLRAEGGPPAVFARRSSDRAVAPVVFYAHYDGQPVVPALWASDPFEVVIRTGRLEDGAEEVPFGDIES